MATRSLKKIEKLEVVDIVISSYNQEKLIERVLDGIVKNTITPFNFILVFDGCTDNTQMVALNFLDAKKRSGQAGKLQNITVRETQNVFETKANNVGFRLVTTPYFITVQDDMVVDEYAWEKRLTYPLRRFDDVFAVTARGAQDLVPTDGFTEKYTLVAERQFGLPRHIFAVRDVINRGPVAFKTESLKKLNYLNEAYAPYILDDADLCLRAWEKFNWRAGAFWINYVSELSWGKTRAKGSTVNATEVNQRNVERLYKDHREYIEQNVKHSVDYKIDDRDIASYDGFSLPQSYKNPLRSFAGKTIRTLGLRNVALLAAAELKKINGLLTFKVQQATLSEKQPEERTILLDYIQLEEAGYISKKKLVHLIEEYEKNPALRTQNNKTSLSIVGLSRMSKRAVKSLYKSARFVAKTVRDNGPVSGCRQILSFFFRNIADESPRIAYHSLQVSRKIWSTPKDLESIAYEERERPWYKINGDKTLRLNYPLTGHSVAVDIGGFRGNWAADILNMYGCNVHVFEPVREFSKEIQNRFLHNKKVHVYPYGLGARTEEVQINLEHGSSSIIRKFAQRTKADILDIHEFLEKLGNPVDLMKINIEGAEYDLLDRLIETGDVSKIQNLQIQFHSFVPNANERRMKIQAELSRTHELTYNYDFIWENWKKKT